VLALMRGRTEADEQAVAAIASPLKSISSSVT
jgi:hypothetical protein